MAVYTFKHKDTGTEREITCSFAEYDNEVKAQQAQGYHRVYVPVFVKDSGSGRG